MLVMALMLVMAVMLVTWVTVTMNLMHALVTRRVCPVILLGSRVMSPIRFGCPLPMF
jgi:hypothetical protein